jgi:hypothetical protein
MGRPSFGVRGQSSGSGSWAGKGPRIDYRGSRIASYLGAFREEEAIMRTKSVSYGRTIVVNELEQVWVSWDVDLEKGDEHGQALRVLRERADATEKVERELAAQRGKHTPSMQQGHEGPWILPCGCRGQKFKPTEHAPGCGEQKEPPTKPDP